MNANELANLLEVDSWYKLVTREEIATMLRQQQAEIKELKLARLADLDVILKQRAEIELLFKEIPEWKEIVNRNSNKPNPQVGNLDKKEYVYKMGDIDWTKALK